jgi:hypothetical protein
VPALPPFPRFFFRCCRLYSHQSILFHEGCAMLSAKIVFQGLLCGLPGVFTMLSA